MELMDLEALRANTPGCQKVIHFNNAGAALVSADTLRVQLDYLEAEAELGGYEVAAKFTDRINEFYTNTAELINCSPEEIAFTESATVAWQRAFWSIDFKENDEIVCDSTSYASNYIAFLNAKKRFGVEIKLVGQTTDGSVDLEDLESNISSKSKLISITHMPTNSGLVNPVEEIGLIAQKHDILYQVDACQSAGQYPLDVHKINCDFLSATGRKYLRGPRGTGFLYVKSSRIKELTPLSLDLHSAEWHSVNEYVVRGDAKVFETWECSSASKLGLSQAVAEVNTNGINAIWKRTQDLANYLRQEVATIDTISCADIGEVKSGIVTLSSSKVPVEELKAQFTEEGINTVVAIKSGTLIDMDRRGLNAVLRVSVHYYNTNAEIDRFVALLNKLVQA